MLWTLCPKSPGLTKCRGGHEINEDSGWDSNFMQFLVLDLPLDSKLFSCFLFLFLDMRSFHQPISWRSRAKWTFVAKAPCVLALLVQGAKAGALLDRSAMFHAGWCSKMVPFFKIIFFPLLFSFPKSIGKEVAFKTQVTNFNPESATQASGKDAPLELDNETCLKHTRFWLHILTVWTRIWSDLIRFDQIWSFFGLVFDWNFRLTKIN